MKTKYLIDDEILILQLHKEYCIQAVSVEFIPMGDSAYSYRVNCCNGDTYYLKLFDHKHDRQRKAVERLQNYLPLTWTLYHSCYLTNITYPIKKQNGEFITTFNDLTFVLFPFIEGETLAEAYPFSKELLNEVAKEMALIHQVPKNIAITFIEKETFDISFESDLLKCLSVLEGPATKKSQIINSLRDQIVVKKEQIIYLLKLVRKLRVLALDENKDKVLCHGDLWGGNLILQKNKLFIIDWEAAMIAPPEFDLFSYLGDEFEVFLTSYQKYINHTISLNLDLLRFYSYRHHLRNLANWLMNILYRNTDEAQNENDLEMIIYHCMNRWDNIEPNIIKAEEIIKKVSLEGKTSK
ncbi:aminoglycoside phosphotransferase [Bacillus sp. SA1-12]|uniref:phosphotransferase n=1 Tax=Bacillus sp. SA1-12 TaxID=1455638 RepID=UPI0006270ADE|nr:phosphotransferase [Bacillus sp. SA1-12]KKI89377.1 aminoglycoside phosphotransferase [Bacillus sp. SA1-12]